ncbi:MAG: hypothetical protein KA397_07765 [Paludibacteraceae bacterium]|nr:hypothetical protein [Paludibacteraceae bacterium]MBP6285231.1 hypothetical protein [Paludibacteraceae bacterium]
MKKLLLSFISFLVAFLVWAEKPVFKNKFFPNGNLMYEGYFVNNHPVGVLKRYHENGKIKAFQEFISKDTVRFEYFAGDGCKVAKGLFVKEKKHGVWEYFTCDDHLLMLEKYDNGWKQGEALVFSKEGVVIDRMNYQNDVLHGKRIQYYSYGSVLAKYAYKEGLLDGEYESYYETGQKDEQGFYLANKKHGVWTVYKEDGTIETVEYEHGIATNQTELDRRLQEQMDKNEQGDASIQDPQDYIENPDAYLMLFRQ